VSQERLGLFVAVRVGDHDDVHAPQLVYLVVRDLREDDLLPKAERVVAAAVERLGRHTFEVASGSEFVRGDLARAVVAAGWDLNELRPAALSLEAIFLQLTGEEKAAKVAASEPAKPEQLSNAEAAAEKESES